MLLRKVDVLGRGLARNRKWLSNRYGCVEIPPSDTRFALTHPSVLRGGRGDTLGSFVLIPSFLCVSYRKRFLPPQSQQDGACAAGDGVLLLR